MRAQFGDPHLHFWLTRSVARAMGVSLSDAMASDRLSPKAYADLITACRGCVLVETCKGWLAGQTTLAGNAPPGCVNTQVLEGLARPN